MEEADNGTSLKDISVDTSSEIKESTIDVFGFPVTALDIKGARVTYEGTDEFISSLYRIAGSKKSESVDVRLIPYRLWANRGEGEMSVFMGIL